MKKALILTVIGLAAVMLSPILLILFVIAVFVPKFRKWALLKLMVARFNYETRNWKPEPEPHGLVIDKLSELKVNLFIKISVTGDLNLLLIEGKATNERLHEAWADIQADYYERAGGNNAVKYREAKKKIARLNLRLNHVQALCDQFELIYHAVFADALRHYGYNLPFTEESYLKDLRKVKTGEKRIKSMYDHAVRQFEKDFAPKDGKKQTEDDYYNTLEEIRKHGGYQDTAEALAEKWYMDTYARLLAKYNEHIQKMNEKAMLDKTKKK